MVRENMLPMLLDMEKVSMIVLLKIVKRKLKVSGSELYEDADSKLWKVETHVVEKLEISRHNLANADDGMLGEINRLKAIKITDGGVQLRESFFTNCWVQGLGKSWT